MTFLCTAVALAVRDINATFSRYDLGENAGYSVPACPANTRLCKVILNVTDSFQMLTKVSQRCGLATESVSRKNRLPPSCHLTAAAEQALRLPLLVVVLCPINAS